MVASGGGGYYGNGGGLIGTSGPNGGDSTVIAGTGGTQLSGGTGKNAGIFGKGGTGYISQPTLPNCNDAGGGGGGYYGGGGAQGGQPVCSPTTGVGGGGGGSSFISGYAGVNAIVEGSTSEPRSHTNNTLHYSGKYFINGYMQSGVNEGDGKAKITYLGEATPERTNTKLNNVRYIKDCINGSSSDGDNHWVELQVIKNGQNIAKGKIVTGIENNTLLPLTRITDGDITSANIAAGAIYNGNQCITLDLGTTQNIDEIAVWHYWADGRTYNNNITYVSSDNNTWTTVINKQEPEKSQGKRVSAYDTNTNIKANYSITNLITNGSFENGTTGWITYSNASLILSDVHVFGNSSMIIYPIDTSLNEAYIRQEQSINFINTHKYYASVYVASTGGSLTQIYFPEVSPFPSTTLATTGDWKKDSLYVYNTSIPSGNYMFRLDHDNNGTDTYSLYDGVLLIDLTATFGVGNEPTKEWCDENIDYFDGTITKSFSSITTS